MKVQGLFSGVWSRSSPGTDDADFFQVLVGSWGHCRARSYILCPRRQLHSEICTWKGLEGGLSDVGTPIPALYKFGSRGQSSSPKLSHRLQSRISTKMFFKLPLLLSILISTVVASPLHPRDATLTEAEGVVFPNINAAAAPSIPGLGTRSPNTGLHEFDTRANPTLLLCGSYYCDSDCYSYTLYDRTQFTCYNAYPLSYFYSVGISNPNSGGLPYAIYVGSACRSPPASAIPLTNTCYNIDPAGSAWYIT
ncbi:hypothetical protein JAAARDRAFT_689332 [Jaapia argillacea MUCL 33604]|uniref:Uncharacterized protein n=1 Tax=Jaapia argillacea MUCL 33604 TaxID=933084 RepID=A0A067PZ89_9AGAM|nr:hypothetical protein JAAARDRAFT_689332 [Jaapia argillacea MUCL 33604]